MEPLFNVNDNAHTERKEPTKNYENINDTSNINTSIVKKREKEVKDFVYIGILLIIFIILLLMLIFGVKVGGSKDIGQETFYTTDTNAIDIHDVSMKAIQYNKTNTVVNITLTIENNSENNIYLTAKGIYLTSQNNVYCPSVLATTISSKFYGQPIKPGETVTATLTYNGVVDEPTTLVVSNVIDQKNLAWTNAISIK